MTDTATDTPEEPTKPSKLPMIIGLVLAIVGAGAGFFAVQKGFLSMILSSENHESDHTSEPSMPMPDTENIAFVEIDPIMISLTDGGQIQYLRFRAQLEVEEADKDDVMLLLPRVVDVLNSYLRAVETSEFSTPSALTRLRGQMLRRIQIVVGKDRVRDLLIMDFVLN